MNSPTPVEQDLHTYSALLQLWQAENPIKTIKLQFLLITNAGLLGFSQISNEALGENFLLGAGGFVLNLIWTLSIGRTSLFQKAWKIKLDEIAQRHPDDARFQVLDIRSAETQAPGWLRGFGTVSSKYYLLGTPITFSISWLCVALLSL